MALWSTKGAAGLVIDAVAALPGVSNIVRGAEAYPVANVTVTTVDAPDGAVVRTDIEPAWSVPVILTVAPLPAPAPAAMPGVVPEVP